MTVGESASNHNSTTGDHFVGDTLEPSRECSSQKTGRVYTGGINFSENRNPCLTSIRRTKKQLEVIGKMGKNLQLTQTFKQDR